MTTAAEKLNLLLDLARAIHYQPPLPRELSIGDLQDFTRLHAEIVSLLEADAEVKELTRERAALRWQLRGNEKYLQRCFDDLRHAEARAEDLRAERDEARRVARELLPALRLEEPQSVRCRELLRCQYPWLEEQNG